jgi:hypothetical protein
MLGVELQPCGRFLFRFARAPRKRLESRQKENRPSFRGEQAGAEYAYCALIFAGRGDLYIRHAVIDPFFY